MLWISAPLVGASAAISGAMAAAARFAFARGCAPWTGRPARHARRLSGPAAAAAPPAARWPRHGVPGDVVRRESPVRRLRDAGRYRRRIDRLGGAYRRFPDGAPAVPALFDPVRPLARSRRSRAEPPACRDADATRDPTRDLRRAPRDLPPVATTTLLLRCRQTSEPNASKRMSARRPSPIRPPMRGSGPAGRAAFSIASKWRSPFPICARPATRPRPCRRRHRRADARQLIFLTLRPEDETADPADRTEKLYARFLQSDVWQEDGGLVMRRFETGSPYGREELHFVPPEGRIFAARCMRPMQPPSELPSTCLSALRLDGLDIDIRFSPTLLSALGSVVRRRPAARRILHRQMTELHTCAS